MKGVFEYIDEYNVDKENKILVVFDDLITDLINNKKLNSILTELFIGGIKLNISLAFITQSYFQVPKDVRLNTSHFFITKIPNKRELQQIALNRLSDISSKDLITFHKKYTSESYSFLVNDNMLASDNLQDLEKIFLTYKIMTINDQIRDEKLQYDINRETAKISTLS